MANHPCELVPVVQDNYGPATILKRSSEAVHRNVKILTACKSCQGFLQSRCTCTLSCCLSSYRQLLYNNIAVIMSQFQMSLTFVWKTRWELYLYSIFFLEVVLWFDIVIRISLRFPIHRIFSDWLSLVAHSKEKAIFKLLMLKWDRHMVTNATLNKQVRPK